MTSPALSVPRGAALEEAIAILGRSGISSLPVVDEQGAVVGIVSEGDVLRDQLPRDPRAHLRASLPTLARERTVDDVMTPDPRCVTPTRTAPSRELLALKGEEPPARRRAAPRRRHQPQRPPSGVAAPDADLTRRSTARVEPVCARDCKVTLGPSCAV